MRVVAPEPVAAVRPQRDRRAANIEMLGLLAVSAVVLFGIVLTGLARIGRLDEVAPQGSVIPLYALSSPADLEPALTMFDSPRDRHRTALAIYERARAADALDHVGALAGVGSLSRANLQALKPRLDRYNAELGKYDAQLTDYSKRVDVYNGKCGGTAPLPQDKYRACLAEKGELAGRRVELDSAKGSGSDRAGHCRALDRRIDG